jgi:hypothetical protein
VLVEKSYLTRRAPRRPVRAREEVRARAHPQKEQRHAQVFERVRLHVHAPRPAQAPLVEVRAADDYQIRLAVGALDGLAREAEAGRVVAAAIDVEELERGGRDNLANHPLDAALYEVVADVARLRVEVVNAHAPT